MLNTITATINRLAGEREPLRRGLTAYPEDGPGGLFTQPIDVSLLEQLEVDELGRRRSRWLPSDVLL